MSIGNTDPAADGASLDRLIKILWIGTAIGLLALAISQGRALASAIGIGVLIFLAAFASGALLGFLFGVPRVLSSDRPPPSAPVKDPPAAPAPTGLDVPPPRAETSTSVTQTRILQSNTNLERISDWLTTLLVGAGLVQLYKINDALVLFRDFLAQNARVFTVDGVPSAGSLPVVGPVILIFGAVCGFLYMYLSTRLVLIRLFYAIEKFIAGGDRLGEEAQRSVKSIIRGDGGLSSFLQDQFSAKSRLTVEDALSLMYNLLYKAVPDQVIQIGSSLANTDAVRRADYWFYLAAAFGQKLHHADPTSEEWISARDNALDCAQRAVAISPAYRSRLWSISDPASNDNDLAPLRDDPTFRRIVGQPAVGDQGS